jgi:peptidoglycan hydrolase-like protein with peptidoglycan-binding domain
MITTIRHILLAASLAAVPFTGAEVRAQETRQHEPAPVPRGDGATIEEAQKALKEKGYYDGEANGVMTPETRDAIRRYQEVVNLRVTGELDAPTRHHLGVRTEGPEVADGEAPAPERGERRTGGADVQSAEETREPVRERRRPAADTAEGSKGKEHDGEAGRQSQVRGSGDQADRAGDTAQGAGREDRDGAAGSGAGNRNQERNP